MDEYLNTKRIAVDERKKKSAFIGGGILTAFFAFGLIGALTGAVSVEGSSKTDGMLVFICCLIPSALWLLSGLRKLHNIDLARRYNVIFMCDEDGFVTADELAKQTGKPLMKVFKEIDELLRKGYLCNCSLQNTGKAGVMLAGAKINNSEAQGGFISVKCKCCGGTSRIRAGFSGKCEYCGSALNG